MYDLICLCNFIQIVKFYFLIHALSNLLTYDCVQYGSEKYYLIVSLMCNSLITGKFEHLVMLF